MQDQETPEVPLGRFAPAEMPEREEGSLSESPPPIPPLSDGGRQPLSLPKPRLPRRPRRPPTGETPTKPSSQESTREPKTERAVAKELAVAAAGVISAVVLLFQLFGPRPNGTKLREPTKDEYRAMSDPLGRIAARHIPTMNSTLAKDIADLKRSTDGLKDYLQAEPFGRKENLEGV
jgi:hypothetical protein